MTSTFKRGATIGLLATALSTSPNFAQVVEQNPAPLVFGERTSALTARELVKINPDKTPFGVAFKRVILVNERLHGNKIKPSGGKAGIVFDHLGEIENAAALEARLTPYLGTPMSFATIGEIQIAITQFYRDAGLPLVNVTVPPQEISSGGLQVNVITFQLGEKTLEGSSQTPKAFVLQQLRVGPGDQIDPASLGEDIDWLNQNPHRRVRGVFEPGASYGTSDIVLQVEDSRPWSGYAGISNAGTKGTFRTRAFTGFNTTALPWPDHQLSYRLTAAPENISDFRLGSNGTEKGYLSHAVSYFIPYTSASGHRAKFTLEALYADSFAESGTPLTVRNKSFILGAEAAMPLAQIKTGDFALHPEIYAKIGYETLDKEQFFTGTSVSDDDISNARLSLGFRARTRGQLFGRATSGSFDFALENGKSDSSLSGDNSYTYLRFSAGQSFGLTDTLALAVSMRGQVSTGALGTLDQLGFGGVGSVRGYDTNALAGNAGATFSAELRHAPLQFAPNGQSVTLQPYAFADLGRVAPTATTPREDLSSIGLGFNSQINERFTFKAEAAHTLSSTSVSSSGATRAHFELVTRF